MTTNRELTPVTGFRLDGDRLRPMYNPKGHGLRDIREVSGRFFADLQQKWEEHGPSILDAVALQAPQLFFAGMVKLCQVTKVEVGAPGDFGRLSNKEAIVQRLEERSGPKARVLFEKFVKDLEKLQAETDGKAPGEA